MGSFLAKTLFSVLGFPIKPSTILKGLLGIVGAGLLWLAYLKVADHFKHIRDMEAANTQLTADKNKLSGQVDDLKRINQQNAKTTRTTQEQQTAATAIGNKDAATSTIRATKTKEIRDAIDRTPPTTTAVDPVILTTLDRLWSQDPAAVSK